MAARQRRSRALQRRRAAVRRRRRRTAYLAGNSDTVFTVWLYGTAALSPAVPDGAAVAIGSTDDR